MIKSEAPSIVWFRQDLRLEDQPALSAAIAKGGAIIPLFIWAPDEENEWAPGAASCWWLHGALIRLQAELKSYGSTLILRQGPSLDALKVIVQETGADAVFWNRRYEPTAVKRDAVIKEQLLSLGVKAQSFNGSLLFEPWQILNKQQKPYQVFTHYWNACIDFKEPPLPLPKPESMTFYTKQMHGETIESLELLPRIDWDKGFNIRWNPKVYCPQNILKNSIENIVEHYEERRDCVGIEGTTTLSPCLHFGEISPRMIWHAVLHKMGRKKPFEVFLRQLGWRDFAYYLLYHFPQMPQYPLRTRFSGFPWQNNRLALKAWQQGKTGYPIVDAAMRQLWITGWMHNRARMIVGSFLVKDLLIDWREGEKWFWDTLVDADLANNAMGWQWIAGCGVDAAPYFRIFNPMTQGEKFDPNGDYIRRWIPELKDLPNQWIHRPWEAPDIVLRAAGIILGKDYPIPIVDHAEARKRALEAYAG
ncbi:MAG: cryptochrome/photolyase family protein [Parachlamydiaceae bacterium]